MNLYGDEQGVGTDTVEELLVDKTLTQQQLESLNGQLLDSAPIAKIGNIQKYFKIQKQIKAALDEAIKLADENKIRLYQMAQSQLASGKTTLGDDAAFNDLVDTVDSINIVATMHAAKPEHAVSNSEPETVTNNQAVYNGLVQLVSTKLAEARAAGNVEAIEAYETAQKQLQIASKHIDHDAVMGNLIERISATHKNITGEELDTEKLKITENVVEPVVEEKIVPEQAIEAEIVKPENDNIDKKLTIDHVGLKDSQPDRLNHKSKQSTFDTGVNSVEDGQTGVKVVATNSYVSNYQYGKSYTEDAYGNVVLNSEFFGEVGVVGYQDHAVGVAYDGDNIYKQTYNKVNFLSNFFREEETLVEDNGIVTAREYQQDIGFGFLKFYNDKVDGVNRKQAKIGNVFGRAAYKNISTQVSHDKGSIKSSENSLFGIIDYDDTKINNDSGSYRQRSLNIMGVKLTFTKDKESGLSGLNLNLFGRDVFRTNKALENKVENTKLEFKKNVEATKGIYGNFIDTKNNMTAHQKVDQVTARFAKHGQDIVNDKRIELDKTDCKIIPMTNTKNTSKMQA